MRAKKQTTDDNRTHDEILYESAEILALKSRQVKALAAVVAKRLDALEFSIKCNARVYGEGRDQFNAPVISETYKILRETAAETRKPQAKGTSMTVIDCTSETCWFGGDCENAAEYHVVHGYEGDDLKVHSVCLLHLAEVLKEWLRPVDGWPAPVAPTVYAGDGTRAG